MKGIKIAIDGYSGTGKSSTAREVAKRLGFTYIDSGAMYRAVTFHALDKGLDISDHELMAKAVKQVSLRFSEGDHSNIYLNGHLLGKELRGVSVSERVSDVAAIAEVRREMVRQQQAMVDTGGTVMDGRDIGTMVFPEAELKVFMTASEEVRARRRQQELQEKGIESDLESIKANLKERDRIDSTREEGPLRRAKGAFEIDTTDMTFESQVNMIVEKAQSIMNE